VKFASVFGDSASLAIFTWLHIESKYSLPNHPTKLINFKNLRSLKVRYMFRQYGHHQVLKIYHLMSKLLLYIDAVNTHAGPSNVHVCWS
jgi:hypothetical protein